jgi:hypothetical protein
MKRLAIALALALASGACGSDKTSPPASGSASVGSARDAEAAATGVKIFVDDVQVGMLANDQVQLWPRLDTLIPVNARRLGTWDKVELKGGAAPVTLAKPSSAYPELVPALFPGDGGKPAFGMFDPVELAKKGEPARRENLVTEVRITLAKGTGRGENEHGSAGAADPTKLVLSIKTKAGDKVIEGTKLLELPREAPPGETEGKGWKLSTLLAQVGVTKYKRVLVSDGAGTNLTLEPQDLDEKTAVPFVKLNRQGALRFRVYRKQADSWQPGSDLRGLTHIEVLK